MKKMTTKNKRKAVLSNKGGFSYILTCIIIIFAMLLIFAGLQYRYIYHVASEQQKYVQLQLDSYVTSQSINYFDALKQGEPYENYIDKTQLVDGAYNLLGFPRIITLEYREVISGKEVYTMSRPEIYALTGGSVGLYVKYTLTIPFEMFGRKIADIRVPVEAVSRFTEKY